MGERPLISIIIPVYNTRDYLYKCLNSVRNQTYDNIEIICVDDGSTDGSELIVDEFAKQDKRFKVVHKANGGESSARNVGLRMATGDYWTFLDCDDWLEPDMYERLVGVTEKYSVDVVASSWYKDTENESIKIENKSLVKKGVFGKEDFLLYLYQRDYYRGFSYMWNKIYRKELFFDEKQHLILFPEDLELGGDVYYLARLALNANVIYYLEDAFYHYVQRESSGVHTKSLKKRIDWLKAYERVITYIDDNDIKTNATIWIKRFLAYHSSNTAEMAYEQKNDKVLELCQKIMRQYYSEYCDTNKDYEERISRFNDILDYRIEQA